MFRRENQAKRDDVQKSELSTSQLGVNQIHNEVREDAIYHETEPMHFQKPSLGPENLSAQLESLSVAQHEGVDRLGTLSTRENSTPLVSYSSFESPQPDLHLYDVDDHDFEKERLVFSLGQSREAWDNFRYADYVEWALAVISLAEQMPGDVRLGCDFDREQLGLHLAYAQFLLGQFENAIDSVKSLPNNPSSVKRACYGLFIWAVATYRLGNLEEAKKWFKRIIAMGRKDGSDYTNVLTQYAVLYMIEILSQPHQKKEGMFYQSLLPETDVNLGEKLPVSTVVQHDSERHSGTDPIARLVSQYGLVVWSNGTRIEGSNESKYAAVLGVIEDNDIAAAQVLFNDTHLVTLTRRANEYSDGKQPLHLACEYGRLEIVCLLIERGADVNVRTALYSTPIHFSTIANNFSVTRELLANGANVENHRNIVGRTPLHLAVCEQLHEMMKFLLASGASVEGRLDNAGMTPLWSAVDCKDTEAVNILIDAGANVHFVHPWIVTSFTLLHLAVAKGNVDIVKSLVRGGADVDRPDGHNRTPAWYNASENEAIYRALGRYQ